MRKGGFLKTITFMLLVWILGLGWELNVVAAQGPIEPETGPTSKPIPVVAPPSDAHLVTDPALMPPGPPPANTTTAFMVVCYHQGTEGTGPLCADSDCGEPAAAWSGAIGTTPDAVPPSMEVYDA